MNQLGRSRIDDELRFHIEQLERMLVAEGMTPEEASQEASRRFGSVERYRMASAAEGRLPKASSTEGVWTATVQDLRYAWSSLLRAPAFTGVTVLILALGIGANTALFSVIHGVLVRPMGLTDPAGIVSVLDVNPSLGVGGSPTSAGTLLDWREQSRTLESIGAYQWVSTTLEDPDGSRELQTVAATGNYFATLGVQPVFGRLPVEADEIPGARGAVVVLSHALWEEHFGADPGVLGRTLSLDGAPTTVIGVMPPNHVAPGPSASLWITQALPTMHLENRGTRTLHAVGRLAAGASPEAADAEIRAISDRIAETYPVSARGWTGGVRPYRETVVGEVRSSLLMAFAAVGLLLLIACVNVANLVLARITGRQQEIAIRTALGAGRARIARQLLTENMLLSILGGAAGVGVAFGAYRLLLVVEPGVLPRMGEVGLNPVVLLFALGVTMLTGLAFGVIPALRASHASVRGVLSQTGGGGISPPQHRLRKALVMGQMALTLMLLVGAGLLVRTFLELRRVDPGFEADQVAAARIFLDSRSRPAPTDRHLYFESLLDEVRRIPGVTEAGLTSSLPMDPVAVNFDLPFRTEDMSGAEAGELPQADFRIVGPGYFEAMRVTLLSGRLLAATDRGDTPPVVLVNRTMAERHWPGEDPVGRRLETVWGGWAWYEVVGVVGDTRYYGLDSEPRAEMYVPETQAAFGAMTVVARTSADIANLVGQLREAILELDPLQPAHSILPVQDLVSDSMAAERFYATLLGLFAAIATVLAAVGIYGVISYWVDQQTREIGLRMALGATRAQVVWRVVGSGTAVTAGGIALGLLGSFGATRLLGGMLYGVSTLDGATFAAVSLLLATASLAACAVPALRAARLDPKEALTGD